MASRTKYAVDVFLDPSSPPTENKGVIWDATSGSFGLGDAGGSGLTTCSLNVSYNGAVTSDKYIWVSGIDLADNSCIKGELWGKVKDNTRYQMARIVVGFEDQDDTTTRITVKEDVRYPDSKIIYNINSFDTAFQSPTDLKITWTQYTMGVDATTNVDYCFNYVVF